MRINECLRVATWHLYCDFFKARECSMSTSIPTAMGRPTLVCVSVCVLSCVS